VLVLSLVLAVVAYHRSDYASSDLQPAALYIWLSADCEEALIQGRWTLSWALMLGPDADRAATSNFPSHSAPLCGFLVVNKLS